MIQQCSRVFMLSFLFLDWTLCTSFQESRRRFVFPVCPFGEEWYCHPRCYCRPIHEQAVNGGWSEWSSSPCSATCGDGTKHETRSCTNPAPLHGGRNCEGDSVRVTPCHTGQCPKCTDDQHCSCTAGMIGHCRDVTFERKCECTPLPINGGWSEWSSSPCSATCGDGTKHETRSCTNPAPLHGGRNCEGDSVRVTPCHTGQCPTTTPIPTKCTSDVNCTGFNCPKQQYPFCEPYLEWSACGCTECTDNHHCSCPTGMIGNCRDDIFQRKCECKLLPGPTCKSDSDCSTQVCTGNLRHSFCHEKKFLVYDFSSCDCRECTDNHHCSCPTGMIGNCRDDIFQRKCECRLLPGATCKSDSDCSTHVCSGNLSHSFCHEKKFLVYDFSSCDCRECSKDSDCHCQSGWIPSCRTTAFGNTCHCNQSNVHFTHSTTTTKMATTSTIMTPVVSSDPFHESTTQPTHMTSIDVTISTTDSTQTPQSTNTTIPENNTSLIVVTLTTKPQGVRQCHICGDSSNSIPCDIRSIYVGNLQDCAPGENYCMTDLIHNGQTFPSIYKRCVTEEECRNKWLHQTSNLEHCTNYGNVLVRGHYSCHFCCTSDGCNSKQIPDNSSLYIKV
nr:thrombospondin-1 isoform X4 [Crassostrea gigas]